MSQCCKTGFRWQGQPVGHSGTFSGISTYIAPGANQARAILIIHNIFGWTLINARLLADQYAALTDATVYLPDFFDGEIVSCSTMDDPVLRGNFDLDQFFDRHGKRERGPIIESFAKALKARYARVGAIGFCWGGWAVFQLGANKTVDFISTAHPSRLTAEEISANKVPAQVMAPEHDFMYSEHLKNYTKQVFARSEYESEYIEFPELSHGFACRGDPTDALQKEGLEKAINDFTIWCNKHFNR